MELEFCDSHIEKDRHDDFFDLEEAEETRTVSQRTQVDQRDLHDIDTGSGDHGDRCRTKAVEGFRDILVILEFFKQPGDDQNNDDGGHGQRERGKDAAEDTACYVARIGRHVDSDSSGSGLRNRDHVRYVGVGEPVGLV